MQTPSGQGKILKWTHMYRAIPYSRLASSLIVTTLWV